MRGSPGLPTRRCRRIMLESASPIAFADDASLSQCMPGTNLIQIAITSFDGHRIQQNSGYLALYTRSFDSSSRASRPVPENYPIG